MSLRQSYRSLILREARSCRYFFRRQALHLAVLLVLLAVAWALAAGALGDGLWLGVADTTWFWLSVLVAILHQALVWIVWRAQLGWGALTRLFGRGDMVVWGLLFMPLFIARPAVTLALALSDQGSLALPRIAAVILGLGLLAPALYTLYSAEHYFGLGRALGGDHFRRDYREMPLVREGAFRWSGNAMYAFAFLGLWSIAFLAGSQAALSVALFQHAYVWVHYYCTEAPDMALLYGARA